MLERVPSPILRKAFTTVWTVKRRLQFTGWLQYLPPIFLSLPFLVVGLALVFFIPGVGLPLLAVAALLLVVATFDILTVKYHVHLPERRPRRRDGMDLFDLMRARHSCRSFQHRKMTQEDHAQLMASVERHLAEPRLGPAPIRLEYVDGPVTVWPPVNATEFLIAIAPKQYDRFAVMDVGRTLQHVVMDATRAGLGTCWIGPGADHASIKRLLGDRLDSDQDDIICVCAVGYASRFTPAFIRVFNRKFSRVRHPLDTLFFTDRRCTTPMETTAAPFDRLGRTYEICQWAPSSYNAQTTRCAAGEVGGKVTRFDFLAATHSRYYAVVALGIWLANWEMGCKARDVNGRWERLPAKIIGPAGEGGLPVYDISWVLDEPLG